MAISSEDSGGDPFYELLERRKRVGRLETLREFLKWRKDSEEVEDAPEDYDEEINRELSEVVEEKNQELASEAIGQELEQIDPEDLEGDEEFSEQEKQAIYREVKREHEMATAVENELENRIDELEQELDSQWDQAKSFDELKDGFEKLVELKRQYARQVMENVDRDFEEPYEVFFSQYEPHLSLSEADNLLSRLEENLSTLIQQIDEGQFNPEVNFEDILPVDEMDRDQHLEFQKNLLYRLGLDPDRTPIEDASHGLEGGHRYSTPTLIDIDKLLPASSKTSIHEGGHQEYRQGIGMADSEEENRQYLFTPLGEPGSHLVDEALARFWENHIGRTEEFAYNIADEIKQHFDLEEDRETIAEAFHGWMNQLALDNLNRLEADEATYHLHILTRYDVERDLINGNIEVDEVPEIWQDRMEEYLGNAPGEEEVLGEENGILQDPHWFRGKFGYFPQYTLGTALSAQLADSLEEYERELDELIENEDYSEISSWLDENIHQYGKLFETPELIEQATGNSLTPNPLLDYLEEKFVEE